MAHAERRVLKTLRDAGHELSLDDLVFRVQSESQMGRSEVKAAVVPLLYRRELELTPTRKLRVATTAH